MLYHDCTEGASGEHLPVLFQEGKPRACVPPPPASDRTATPSMPEVLTINQKHQSRRDATSSLHYRQDGLPTMSLGKFMICCSPDAIDW